jgi:hypothetical protein
MTCLVEGCGRNCLAKGLCSRHYQASRYARKPRPSIEDRFWAKVDKRGPNDCWPWVGGRKDGGYGSFSIADRQQGAHRVSFFLAHGRWPEPCCLHVCDWPPCVNPAHLFEGSIRDNALDMYAKGRAVVRRGGNVPNAKLTEHDAQVIRVLYSIGCTQYEIAARYGVVRACVGKVVQRKAWAHVPDYDLSVSS